MQHKLNIAKRYQEQPMHFAEIKKKNYAGYLRDSKCPLKKGKKA